MKRSLYISLLLFIAGFVLPLAADTPDMRWQHFLLLDVNGPVYCMAEGPHGELYIGGSFSAAGGIAAGNIACWQGGKWSAPGTGLSGGSFPAVRAIAVAKDGTLYAGGQFTTAGGKAAGNIARWDGYAWSALGGGANNHVNALALGPDGALYAGGAFTAISGTGAGGVAHWQNGQWNQVGSGIQGAAAEVHALLFLEDELYVGGHFTHAGTTPALNIARWDGAAWSALDSGITPVAASVYTLAHRNGILYAAGRFGSLYSTTAVNIRSWNGSAWSAEGIFNGPVRALAFTENGGLAAAGAFTKAGSIKTAASYIAVRTDSAWESPGHGLNDTVNTLVVLPDGSLIAGGGFSMADSGAAHHIARWHKEQWSTLGSGPGTGVNGPIYATAVAPNGDVYIGGDFTLAGATTAGCIARWDGSRWHTLGDGLNGTVNAIAIDRKGMVYAGGSFTKAGTTPANAIARWDGSRWYSLNGNPAHARIYAIAVADDNLVYAGGLFSAIGTTSANCIARWNGAAWTPMNSGVNSTVYAIACRNGKMFIGGSFAFTADADLNSIAEWNGSRWVPLSNGVNGLVYALCIDNKGQLYAGGDFIIPEMSIARLAMWNGLQWQALGQGVNHDVSALVTDSAGTLYAAGYFSMAGSGTASRIAVWNKNTWHTTGSGLNGPPAALALSASRLYVAGTFTAAGGAPSHNFAAWNLCNLAASVTPDGPLTICPGETVTLTAPPGFSSYLWNDGSTLPTLSTGSPGTYSVLVTDSNGCAAESNIVTVEVTDFALNVTDSIQACKGDFVRLYADGALSYRWSPAGNLSCADCSDPAVIATTTETYTVEATGPNGCTTTATVTLTVFPPAEYPTVTVEEALLTSTPAAAYQWYLGDSPIEEATEQTYQAVESGGYAVRTTNENGCRAFSNPVMVTLQSSAVEHAAAVPLLRLYPLPNDGTFTLELSCPDVTGLSLDVRDLLGRSIYSASSPPALFHTLPVKLHTAPGVYLLIVCTKESSLVRQITVR